MADVVVRVADGPVDDALVGVGVGLGVGVRVGGRVGVDQLVVVRHQDQVDRDLDLVDAVDPVDRGDDRGLGRGDRPAEERGVLTVGREGGAVGPQLGARLLRRGRVQRGDAGVGDAADTAPSSRAPATVSVKAPLGSEVRSRLK